MHCILVHWRLVVEDNRKKSKERPKKNSGSNNGKSKKFRNGSNVHNGGEISHSGHQFKH